MPSKPNKTKETAPSGNDVPKGGQWAKAPPGAGPEHPTVNLNPTGSLLLDDPYRPKRVYKFSDGPLGSLSEIWCECALGDCGIHTFPGGPEFPEGDFDGHWSDKNWEDDEE